MSEKCPVCGEPKNPMWFLVYRAIMAWTGLMLWASLLAHFLRYLWKPVQ
jgi:hypothetical protein